MEFDQNTLTILAVGIALWMGGWRVLKSLRQDIEKRLEKLADGLADVRVEVADLRGEMRARLDGRTLPAPPASGQG